MVKKGLDKGLNLLQKDIFAIIWVIFIAIIILLTYYGKEYIKDLIIVSIIFLAFFLLEPIVRMSRGSKIAHMLSGGKYVPPWKRFPIFFVAVVIIFSIKHILEIGLDENLPTESINIILVIFWLISIFLIYHLIFSDKPEAPKKVLPKGKRIHRPLHK